MASYVRYLAPSLMAGDLPKVAQALKESGWPVDSSGGTALHLTVRSLTIDEGTFLEIEGEEDRAWNLSFARSLSAAVAGFVSCVRFISGPGRYGEGLFFTGRTL